MILHFILKEYTMMSICTSIKTPYSNVLVESINQVIYNTFVTKYIDSIVYDYIDPWGGILTSVTWEIRAYC